MPEPLVGQVGAESHISNEYVLQQSDIIRHANPSNTPLTVMLREVGSISTGSHTHHWLEKRRNQKWDFVDTAANASTTTIGMPNPERFLEKDILIVPRTGEQFLVTTTPASGASTLTVARGFGETAGAALLANDRIFKSGSAHEEGSRSQAGRAAQSVDQQNFTQIFKKAAEASRTAMKTMMYGGGVWEKSIEDALRDVTEELELAILHGERISTTVTGDSLPTRKMRGIFRWAKDTIFDLSPDAYGGRLSEPLFRRFMRRAFRFHQTSNLMLVASDKVIEAMTGWAHDRVRFSNDADTLGMSILKYRAPQGVMTIVPHPLLEGENDQGYGGRAIAIDFADVRLVHLKDSDMKWEGDIQERDRDGKKGQYIGELSLQAYNAHLNMGRLENVEFAA